MMTPTATAEPGCESSSITGEIVDRDGDVVMSSGDGSPVGTSSSAVNDYSSGDQATTKFGGQQQGSTTTSDGRVGSRADSSGGNRRLYVGNISDEVTEDALREFFEETGGVGTEAVSKVMMRNGYAFVDFYEADLAAKVAENCNMKTFMNTVMRVEPAEKSPGFRSRSRSGMGRQQSTTKLLVKNCGIEATLKDIQINFSQFGPVTVEQGLQPGIFVVHTSSTKQSDALIREYHGKLIGGSRVVVHSIQDGPSMSSYDGSGDALRMSNVNVPQSMSWKNGAVDGPLMDMDFHRGSTIPSAAYATYQSVIQAAAEPPLKILVPNEYVGAIIGRGGATIRAISKGTGARLDIFRNCSRYDVPEKPVTIYGPPEKASKACRKILEIIIQESNLTMEDDPDLSLKMFGQDSYIGRVIGKGGNVIKKIMDDTQTKIHISTQSDFVGKTGSGSNQTQEGRQHYIPPMLERLITIRGTIEGICKAEAIVSEKLREAYQKELRMYETSDFSGGPRSNYMGGASDDEYLHSNGAGGPPRRKFNSRGPFTLSNNPNSVNMSQYIPGGTYPTFANSSPSGGGGGGGGSYLKTVSGMREHPQINLSRPESVNMYIPDDVVGALIGRRGSNIRQIIQQTGASVKIMEETLYFEDNPMRRVVINGVIDSIFKAQYFIYDKVVEEGKGPVDHQIDDIRLTVEMSVPTEMVGRLIGKAGQNIQDIQRNFLCRIKFMTDPDDTLPPGYPGETFVRITGNYSAFLGAQKKIREMLIIAMTRSFPGFAGGRRRDDGGRGPEESPTESVDMSGHSDEGSGSGTSGGPQLEAF